MDLTLTLMDGEGGRLAFLARFQAECPLGEIQIFPYFAAVRKARFPGQSEFYQCFSFVFVRFVFPMDKSDKKAPAALVTFVLRNISEVKNGLLW